MHHDAYEQLSPLDEDPSVELEALRRKQGVSLKDAVNNALRRGRRAMVDDAKPSISAFRGYLRTHHRSAGGGRGESFH